MDDNGGQRDHGSHRVDYYRGVHPQVITKCQFSLAIDLATPLLPSELIVMLL